MAEQTPEKYKLIGMIIPGGTDKDGNLIVSVCYNINKYCIDLQQTTSNYKEFIEGLLKIQNIDTNKTFKRPKDDLSDVKSEDKHKVFNPFEYSFQNEYDKQIDYESIKNELWTKLFFSDKNFNFTKSIHKGSSVKIYNHGKPDLLYDLKEDESHERQLLDSLDLANKTNTINKLAQINTDVTNKPLINKRLDSFYEFGKNNEKIAVGELKSFKDRHVAIENSFKINNTIPSNDFKLFPGKIFTKAYVEESDIEKSNEVELEIDELIHNFSSITNDPILSRLMGIIVDYKIKVDKIPQEERFFIKLEDTKDVFYMCTPIKRLGDTVPSERSSYIIENENQKSKYFEKSILKNEHTNILTFDMLSPLQNQENIRQRKLNGQNTSDYDVHEVLTRGLLFTHDKLNDLIKPVDIIKKDKDGNPIKNDKGELEFIPESEINEEHFVKGVRVAVNYIDKKGKEYLYPLTSRSVKIVNRKGDKIYYRGDVESCLHIDSPTAYMEEGAVKSSISPVMFEYSGELLKLKSAFAKTEAQKKIDFAADVSNNNHDDGLFKAEERFKKVLTYYNFPELDKEENDSANYNCFYSIPDSFLTNGKAPQLRFNNKYSFMVNLEYQNGYGLPLKNEKGVSIQSIVNKEKKTLEHKSQKFYPGENKKTVTLHHRKEPSEDLSEQNFIDKPSLEHLIVRSNDGDNNSHNFDERHVLPPKISIETAFWYGLLSKLGNRESFEYKKRANCPFPDKESFNKYIYETDENGNIKGNKCIECGKSYCGGTQMEKFYSEKHIHTNHFFTDPSIKGFKIKLFWDKECKREIAANNVKPSLFGGTSGIKSKSYLLRAKAATESLIENHESNEVLEVYLKKGMMIYAQLSNHYGSNIGEVETHLTEGSWWYQLKQSNYKFNFLDKAPNFINPKNDVSKAARQKLIEERNKPKLISLTHAVKEPLITPKVFKLFSTPNDHKHIEHIYEWLNGNGYEQYKIGVNVIANRIDKTNPNLSLINSSFTALELNSHFERIDAIRKVEFLRDITPTGSLELWMRKEEFIDNSDQFVLSTNSGANHFPDQPVVDFSHPNNKFNLDYKIEFSNEMMSQLKDLKNIEDIDNISDVFRSLITKLNLQYDFRTTCFEEREYYLKDISKFKGFFTDEDFNDNGEIKALDKLEEYALPKIKEVKSNSKLRFKVLVLNNSQPFKPDVAFAVTTIQETRLNPERKKTVSIQKGNIVTIYLKRGRLKSGKDERVGVIVDSNSLYNKLLRNNDLISKAGRDIVTDKYSNRSKYLQYGDIIIPELNEYKVAFDNELGIYHFLPKFDIEKQLWKFEVELNIKTKNGKQIHNPFINFSLVHFQPFSINYNDKSADASLLDLKNDCRISDIENSTWCYLLPERKLSVYFDKPNWLFDKYGEVDLTVSFDHESLHHFNYYDETDLKEKWKVRSNFIVSVQGSDDGIIWKPVCSWLDNEQSTASHSENHHPLLTKEIIDNRENLAKLKLKFNKWTNPSDTQHSNRYSHFRVRFIEVEWFKDETWEELIERYKRESPDLLDTDVVDNEEMRIRYVELIY